MWIATSENVVRFAPPSPKKPTPFPVAELARKTSTSPAPCSSIADAGISRIVTLTTSGVETGNPDLPGEIQGASQGVAGTPHGQIAFSQPATAPERIGFLTPPGPAGFPSICTATPSASPTAPTRPSGSPCRRPGACSASPPDVQSDASLGGLPDGILPAPDRRGPSHTLWVTLEKPRSAYEVVRSAASTAERPTEEATAAAGHEDRQRPEDHGQTTGRRPRSASASARPTAGASFECALIKVRQGKAEAAPKPVIFRAAIDREATDADQPRQVPLRSVPRRRRGGVVRPDARPMRAPFRRRPRRLAAESVSAGTKHHGPLLADQLDAVAVRVADEGDPVALGAPARAVGRLLGLDAVAGEPLEGSVEVVDGEGDVVVAGAVVVLGRRRGCR